MIDEDTMGIGNHATIPIKYAVFLATSLKTNPGHPEDASWDVLSVFFSGDIGALDFCESSTAGYQSP